MPLDIEMKAFMKRNNIFIEGVYELPEIREVNPGHLVRSGRSTSYDVNFGKEAGAAAVILLTKGLGGNTVVKVRGTKITYKSTAEVIKQRHVDMNSVALYETLGTCFGRRPGEFKPDLVEEKGEIEREF
jgi:6-phosphofructokinase 1